MVDILGRTGLINEAKDLIDKIPFDATASIWNKIVINHEFVTNKSQEGSQYCIGFGGIGGILSHQV
ncbi:pentatricopeptide repeat-containing At5g04780, partial [Olea europaea subsp. europaea]